MGRAPALVQVWSDGDGEGEPRLPRSAGLGARPQPSGSWAAGDISLPTDMAALREDPVDPSERVEKCRPWPMAVSWE